MTFTPPQDTTETTSYLDVRKEVRFGVVMYGGVSLAIYINGIAQELLHMMRATAPVVEGETGARPQNATELKGTEVIYRKISYLLGGENRRLGDAEADLERDMPPPTAFVVDIISGTSAGGINGIFLGKALANGQDIGSLSKLWVDEGDISKLINDRRSIESPLSLQSPPVSLLNSQRMYYKLLDAFTTMDATGDGEKPSPFVNELDLYVTATDIRGVTVPLRLADNVVHERRHRNVFHFKYAKGDRLNNGRNDFRSANNPFLAYAARCTSAFPFAFEPMRLCDIDDVLGGMKAYCDDRDSRSASARWQPFFKSYLKAETFPLRPFGDGGYLDNKPFTYATEALLRRTADVPVDRKLIYIEPSPEHPERDGENLDPPDAVENVAAALLTLPRRESIREDLQRVLERNRLIQRVNRILSGIERDFERSSMRTPVVPRDPVLSDEEWSKLDLADMVRRKSRGYLGYHRLDIAHVTDLMAALVARLANVDEESDYLVAIRSLIRAWRDGRYTEYRLREDGSKDRRPTMNRFLYQFNYQYALRRLNFLRAKLDQLHRLDNDALDVFRFYAAADLPRDFFDVVNESPASPRRDELRRAVRAELRQIKSEINEVYVELRSRGRLLQSRAKPKPQDGRQAGARQAVNPLLRCFEERHLNEFNLSAAGLDAVLKRILGEDQTAQDTDAGSCARLLAEEECVERAKAELSANADLRNWVNHFAKKLIRETRKARRTADAKCRTILESEDADPAPGYGKAVRACLYHYYRRFDDYDMLTFPILYNTSVGESDVVEVVRFSPEDAKSLIDEERDKCFKLAGTSLAHFGAFLQRLWRENDILWGRLDGAERIITTLLPNHPDAEQLIGQAQGAIVCETIGGKGREEVWELLSESLIRTHNGDPNPEALYAFLNRLKQSAAGTEWAQGLEILRPEEVRDYYRKSFRERRAPEPEAALRAAARATTVVGQVFEGLSNKYQTGEWSAAWVTRVGRIFWGMVEVAVPRSLPSLMFQHWLKLLYLFESLLIVGGAFVPNGSGVQRFGWLTLGITLVVNFVVRLLSDLMSMRVKKLRAIRWTLTCLLVPVVLLGLFQIYKIFTDDPCAWAPASWCDTAQVIWPHRMKTLASVVAGAVLLFLVIDLSGRIRRLGFLLRLRLSRLAGR